TTRFRSEARIGDKRLRGGRRHGVVERAVGGLAVLEEMDLCAVAGGEDPQAVDHTAPGSASDQREHAVVVVVGDVDRWGSDRVVDVGVAQNVRPGGRGLADGGDDVRVVRLNGAVEEVPAAREHLSGGVIDHQIGAVRGARVTRDVESADRVHQVV